MRLVETQSHFESRGKEKPHSESSQDSWIVQIVARSPAIPAASTDNGKVTGYTTCQYRQWQGHRLCKLPIKTVARSPAIPAASTDSGAVTGNTSCQYRQWSGHRLYQLRVQTLAQSPAMPAASTDSGMVIGYTSCQ
jgi:hypothetical protein